MRRTLLAACSALLLAAPAGAAAQGLPNHQRHVMSVGHADVLHITSHVDHFHVEVEDDSGDQPVIRKLTDVLLHAKPESRIAVPDHPDYAFLGEPGEPVWLMPEIQDENLLWPGWNTEGVLASEFPDPTLKLRLLSVDGPAEVSVFTSGPVGEAQMIFDSAKPLPQTAEIINRSHTHANWAFEAEGLYSMKVQVEGRLADGRTITSGAHELRWFVGDLADLPPDPPATPDPGTPDPPAPDPVAPGPAAPGPAAPAAPAPAPASPGPAAPPTTGTPAAVPLPPFGTRPPAPLLRAGGGVRAPALVARGRAAVPCRLTAAGRCTVRLTVSAAAARRLGLRVKPGATRVVVARGARRADRAGTAQVTVRLTRAARRALRRTARIPAIRIDAAATLADGTRRTGRTTVPAAARTR